MGLKPIVNFSGGEASPKLFGRADTVPYNTAAETLENVIVTRYGSAFRTPGTRFIAQGKDSSTTKRLIPFIFSTGDSFMLEFGNLYMRFYQSGGSVVETAKTITGTTQANPVVITSASHGYSNGDYIDISGIVGMIEINQKRFIAANVTANTFELTNEDAVNVDGTTFTAYASGGIAEEVLEVVTKFTTADLPNLKFTQQADVMYIASGSGSTGGKPLQKLSRFSAISWTIADILYDTIAFPAFLDINTTATTITPSATTGAGITLTASTGIFSSTHVGSYWKLTHGATTGYVKVTAFNSSTSVTATVIVTLGAITATSSWHEGAWSDKQGHPIDVKFFQGRLVVTATISKPLTIWESVIEENDNFNIKVGSTVTDSDGFSITLSSAQIDRIQWAYPTNVLNVGTAGGPFTVDVSSATNINQAKQQNENGSSDVNPVRIGPFVYYVERSGEILGEFSFSFDKDQFLTEDITYLNDHILKSGVKEMSLQRYPDQILWCVLNNGTMATLTREITQNVKGWTRQIMSGTSVSVESIASIPNGESDQVWIVIKRTINSVTRRYIEYFEVVEPTLQDDEFYVQSGSTYSGVSTTTLINLDHLEGETVSILGNGAVQATKVVTNGSIVLDIAVTKAQVGLAYTSIIKTLDIEQASAVGSAQTRVKTISRATVRLYKSLGMQVGDTITQDIVPFRTSADLMDQSVNLFTGDKEVSFPSGHLVNKHIIVKQVQPLPMHVLGIYSKILVSP